ncbi:hypothetical protein BDW22DRAFT_1422972 [Trametopsis cervina]|nr:hypothetical protein BDW22DRAFT_1422972 [Trametopsis cervina]
MSTSVPPSATTFSFTAPFPPPSSSASSPASLKQQRRVSLALPSSPRQFPAWTFRDDTSVGVGVSSPSALVPEKKGKIRRIASDNDDGEEASGGPSTFNSLGAPGSSNAEPLKKPRKKWTADETQMLVDGCNKWGVGNWKAILNDPDLKFDNRSPVDLKDRFRTYFPDAYKHHYPNARTHLSSKTRSTHPDGTPLFCASRSKKRRPFTPEEDAALKAGYDKHGTVWATIVKDPIFQDQNRRSTDLRDRFRNAWPELYAKAGYKPRATAGKKKKTAEADNLGESSGARFQPMRAATDDQLPTTSALAGPIRRKRRHTTQGFGLFRGGTKSVPESTTNSEDEDSGSEDEGEPSQGTSGPSSMSMDMDMSGLDLGVPDLTSSSSLSMSEMTESSQSHTHTTTWSDLENASNAWSASRTPGPAYAESLAASPTPSTDYLLPHSPVGMASNSMIGKSAWGTQDWLSPNPRLDGSGLSAHTSFSGMFSPSPLGSPSGYDAHPHSLSLAHVSYNHLSLPGSHSHGPGGYTHSHGVVDRYDLFPMSQGLDTDLDFISEGFDGTGDAHSAFSDPPVWVGTSDVRRGGFTHHSNYAGDLIFGARTHQPSRMDYGPGFGFGLGLGLEGVQTAGGVLRTPVLPGIDEIDVTNITLEDPREPDQDMPLGGSNDGGGLGAPSAGSPVAGAQNTFAPLALDELVGIPTGDAADDALGRTAAEVAAAQDTSHHATPPATPALGGYRMSGRPPLGGGSTASTAHHRSISVPPSEHRAFASGAVAGAKHKSLMATPTRAAFIPLVPPPPTWAEAERYQVPFLDLHYYTAGGGAGDAGMGMTPSAAGMDVGALDLAYSLGPPLVPVGGGGSGGVKPLCIPPSLVQLVLDGGFARIPALPSLPQHHQNQQHQHQHQRGQSQSATATAVSPADLELRKGSDNKRKRASWDGGPR